MSHGIERFSLKGKIILLTGGSGLYGRGLSTELAAAGAELIVASRNLEACAQVAREETANGHKVHAEQLDQGSEESVLALRDAIVKKFGRLDGLVNNSVARPMTSVDAPVSQWEESMRVNATGIYLMHRYFGEVMAAQSGGSIVNIGSIQGNIGPHYPLYEGLDMRTPPPDYFFHKGGMINLTRFYAGLLGPSNVRVNCLGPGGFQYNQPEEFIKRYSAQTMLGRMGNDSDLGGAVIFLLSDASAYITGANIPVDGGYTAK